jgi:hypothetical protein
MPPAGQRAHPGTAAILARCPIALGRTLVSEPSSEPLVEPVARVWLRSNVPPDRCVRPIMVAPSNPPWTDHDSVPPSRASRLHGSWVPTSAGDNGMRTIAGDGCLYDPSARRFRASVARGRRHSDEDYGTMLKNTWQEGYFSRRSSSRSISQPQQCVNLRSEAVPTDSPLNVPDRESYALYCVIPRLFEAS